MTITQQIAKQVRDFYSGGNWTGVNLKDSLEGISWQQSITKVHSSNTIEALVFHMNYYVNAMLIEQLPEQKLNENLPGNKYGTWLRNIEGAIEHCHYHLGQIVLIKKILLTENEK
jgi:hypothetical protein